MKKIHIKILLSICLMLLQGLDVSAGETAEIRVSDQKTLRIPALLLATNVDLQNTEKQLYLSMSDLTSALRQIDPALQIDFDKFDELLQIRGKKLSASLYHRHIVINGISSEEKHSLIIKRDSVFIPASTVQALLDRSAITPIIAKNSGSVTTSTLPLKRNLLLPPASRLPVIKPINDVKRPLVISIGGVYQRTTRPEIIDGLRDAAEALKAKLEASDKWRCHIIDPRKKISAAEQLNLIREKQPAIALILQLTFSKSAGEKLQIYFPSSLHQNTKTEKTISAAIEVASRHLANKLFVAAQNPTLRATQPIPAPLFISSRLSAPSILVEIKLPPEKGEVRLQTLKAPLVESLNRAIRHSGI